MKVGVVVVENAMIHLGEGAQEKKVHGDGEAGM